MTNYSYLDSFYFGQMLLEVHIRANINLLDDKNALCLFIKERILTKFLVLKRQVNFKNV